MKFVWVLIGSFLFFSCQDIEEVKRPKNLIPEQKMAEVLTDLTLLYSAKNYNRKFLEETGIKPDEFLYNKHNIDSAQLSQSTRYYASDPNKLEAIYKRVNLNLEKLQMDLEAQKEENIQDSISNKTRDSLIQDSITLRARISDSLIMTPPEQEQEDLN